MVKHTQTVPRQQPTNSLNVFDHIVGLALKGLSKPPIIHEQKVSLQRPPDIFRNVKKDLQQGSLIISFHQNSSFDQSFLYIWFKPLHTISCSMIECLLSSSETLSCTQDMKYFNFVNFGIPYKTKATEANTIAKDERFPDYSGIPDLLRRTIYSPDLGI